MATSLLVGCGTVQSDADLQAELDEKLCTLTEAEQDMLDSYKEIEDGFFGCEIEVRAEVVTMQVGPMHSNTDTLEAIGDDYGWWNGADVQRMNTARALDGTIESSDGRATWNYHPDNGLQIVVER